MTWKKYSTPYGTKLSFTNSTRYTPPPSSLNWSARKMYTIIKEAKSETQPVKAGVPQGSILGPTLFNIYINDIPTTNDTQLATYADDTAVYASSWNSTQASKYLQTRVNFLAEYFKKWKLEINPKKTQAITFTRKLI